MTREKRLRLIAGYMDMFGDLPSNYDEFVEKSVFKLDNIIIYSTKENTAYCTGCKSRINNLKTFEIKLKHDKQTICPCCGRVSVAKSKGYIKNGFNVIRWSVLMQKYDNCVLIRYINHMRHYHSNGAYEQTSRELCRTVMNETDTKSFGCYWDGWAFWRKPMGYFERSEYYEPKDDVMLYNTDITPVIRGTAYQYSAADIFTDKYLRHTNEYDSRVEDNHVRIKIGYGIENYLHTYRNYPYLEQFVKVGLFGLVNEVEYGRTFRSGQKKINDTLGLTRSQYLQLMALDNPTYKSVEIIKSLHLENVNVSNNTLKLLTESRTYSVHDFISVRKYMSENKAIKQLTAHGTQYVDYLKMADKVGWNMKSSMVLFPKDVKKAHDIATDQYNKAVQQKTEEFLKGIIDSQKYEFVRGKFKIVVPRSGASIVNEGHVLHHCVASYVDDVRKGKTMILFIRHIDTPFTPFYTLEWKNNEVRQCYGLKDCKTTPEVQEFVNEFTKEMHKRGKRKQIAG